MVNSASFLQMIPVLPSEDVKRDIKWYASQLGFELLFGDEMYCGLRRENMEIHLQWHANTEEDPIHEGSVIKLFVDKIEPFYEEFVERGTIPPEKLRRNTPWGTHEFGFFDLNRNAIFIVQDA